MDKKAKSAVTLNRAGGSGRGLDLWQEKCIFVIGLFPDGDQKTGMHSPEIKEFIQEQSALFWYTPEDKKEEISLEYLAETMPESEIKEFLIEKAIEIV